MKTEDLITDLDKKITHFLEAALQSDLSEDFDSVKSCVHSAKELIEELKDKTNPMLVNRKR